MTPYTEGGVVYFAYTGSPQLGLVAEAAIGKDAAAGSQTLPAEIEPALTLLTSISGTALPEDSFVLPAANDDDMGIYKAHTVLDLDTLASVSASFGGYGDHAVTLFDPPGDVTADLPPLWTASTYYDPWS